MIKFRVWDPRYNKYLEQFVVAFKNYQAEQFTGLQDKNGKDIYVGDIVRVNHTLFVVEFNSNAAQCELKNKDLTITFWNVDKDSREVIGNINENKELLKNEKN